MDVLFQGTPSGWLKPGARRVSEQVLFWRDTLGLPVFGSCKCIQKALPFGKGPGA